ncbi:MAG: 16S rRNA (cytidine(1402)-2'-O)-methyltransferase [Bacteroidetes bacterium]|nr:MAG: 16S rRNA (cytidine(1402)-2'-O)-methyltransferase [Bacteroidota bacterium]
MAGKDLTQLFLVPTPIGNLGDITYRAVEILKTVDLILAEDTRTSGKLLKKYDIQAKLKSFHIHNEHKTITSIIDQLNNGVIMALVSDAGTPGISDPGYLLVKEALASGISIEALPGATAFVPALIKSGFPTDRFVFEGFLPHKKGRQTRLKGLVDESRTIIFYESPHRLLKFLGQIAETFGSDKQISVSRELTKLYEETITGSVTEVIEYYAERTIKGELVVVVAGKK